MRPKRYVNRDEMKSRVGGILHESSEDSPAWSAASDRSWTEPWECFRDLPRKIRRPSSGDDSPSAV